MGNSNSKTNNGILYAKDVIVNDEITNYHEANIMSCIKYPDKNGTNYLIGYNYSVSLNCLDYIKYENGLYLYTTKFYDFDALFGCNGFDVVNNIRIKNENDNIKMYIRIEINYRGGETLRTIYEAENLELKSSVSSLYKISFFFVTKEPIINDICISSTKYMAGPYSFREYISRISDVYPMHITNGPLKILPKIITYNELSIHIGITDAKCSDEKIEKLKVVGSS